MSESIGIASVVTSIIAPSLRYIVWPLVTLDDLSALGGFADGLANALGGLSIPQVLTGYVPIVEEHRDELTITEHPVEQGSAITDHAFKLPAMLTLRLGWSTSQPANSPNGLQNKLTAAEAIFTNGLTLPTLAGFFSTSSDVAINNIYNTLLTLQVNRTLVTVATARRLYQNLLLQGLSLQTDEKTEHALVVTATLKEVIRVSSQTLSSPVNPTANSDPQGLNPTNPQGQQNLAPSNATVNPADDSF